MASARRFVSPDLTTNETSTYTQSLLPLDRLYRVAFRGIGAVISYLRERSSWAPSQIGLWPDHEVPALDSQTLSPRLLQLSFSARFEYTEEQAEWFR